MMRRFFSRSVLVLICTVPSCMEYAALNPDDLPGDIGRAQRPAAEAVMTADSYLELVLIFMGWLMNNALWHVITATGLFTLPLIFRIAGIWLALRETGEDEDAKGFAALARTEHVLYLSFVVMMFCAGPVWDTDLSAMYFDRIPALRMAVTTGEK